MFAAAGLPKVLSAMQAKRLVRSGCISYLLSMSKVAEGPDCDLQSSSQSDRAAGLKPLHESVQDNKDIFPDELPDRLSPDRGVGHTIPLEPGSKANYGPLYSLSPAESREVERQVKEYLKRGFIENSKFSHASPVIFVAKKDGTL